MVACIRSPFANVFGSSSDHDLMQHGMHALSSEAVRPLAWFQWDWLSRASLGFLDAVGSG
jgi:hypothetical protein